MPQPNLRSEHLCFKWQSSLLKKDGRWRAKTKLSRSNWLRFTMLWNAFLKRNGCMTKQSGSTLNQLRCENIMKFIWKNGVSRTWLRSPSTKMAYHAPFVRARQSLQNPPHKSEVLRVSTPKWMCGCQNNLARRPLIEIG